jgi:hypothetical protein
MDVQVIYTAIEDLALSGVDLRDLEITNRLPTYACPTPALEFIEGGAGFAHWVQGVQRPCAVIDEWGTKQPKVLMMFTSPEQALQSLDFPVDSTDADLLAHNLKLLHFT